MANGGGHAVPTAASDIVRHVSTIAFNEPFRREIELSAFAREVAGEGFALGGLLRRRLRGHRFHLVALGQTMRAAALETGLPDRALISNLFASGRRAGRRWLSKSFDDVGVRSSVDLGARFL